MSREPAPPFAYKRSEIVFEVGGGVRTSCLWEDFPGVPAVPGQTAGGLSPDPLEEPTAIPQIHRPLLRSCRVCPHSCGVNRLAGEKGRCHAEARIRISRWGPELGEEASLVGPRGSGVIFFSHCPMACLFCHNFEATQEGDGEDWDEEGLARIVWGLARWGCSNIHLISPTHYAPQIADVLTAVRGAGLRLPVVYNCGGYESLPMLKRLEGLVDIYLPDFKFGPEDDSEELGGAPNYYDVALQSIVEMARQVGPLQVDGAGLARRGLLVRHLVLPARARSSEQILVAIRQEIGPGTTVHLMSSYHPAYRSFGRPDLGRRIEAAEYRAVAELAAQIGLNQLILDHDVT